MRLYGFDPQTRHYLAFLKGKGRSYAVYQRNAEGMRRIAHGTSRAIHANRSNRLALVPDKEDVVFFINDTPITTVKREGGTAGAAGLVAISDGMFVFDNFTLYQASASKPATANDDPVNDQMLPIIEEQGDVPKAEHDMPGQPVNTVPESQPDALKAYKTILKKGMPRNEVVRRFGPGLERGANLFYDLGIVDPAMENRTLIIHFDENDTVLAFKEMQG